MKQEKRDADRPFFERTQLRFQCTGCGECCTGGGDYHVFVGVAEAEAIRQFSGLSRAWFRRRYIQRLESGELVLTSRGDDCVFLDADRRCRIYPVRPLQCRSYPFWPELVNSRRAWEREGCRCEGIGRGAVVAKGKVIAWLRLHAETGDG